MSALCPPTFLDMITLIIFAEWCKLRSALFPSITSLMVTGQVSHPLKTVGRITAWTPQHKQMKEYLLSGFRSPRHGASSGCG